MRGRRKLGSISNATNGLSGETMLERHLARLRARHRVSAEEEAAIRALARSVRDVGAQETFVEAGRHLDVSILIIEGIVGRYREMRNGQRQITELHVPGDFADLHSFTLKRLDHNLVALTPGRIMAVPHAQIEQLMLTLPRLARLYWFSTNLDAAIHREWVTSMGCRDALARLAHLFCELHIRLRMVGLADEDRYTLNLTQSDLGNCVGLTSIHVNRTLRKLRELDLIAFRNGTVTFLDLAGARAIAEFDPSYLYLDPDPI